jgi:hypothetical protein
MRSRRAQSNPWVTWLIKHAEHGKPEQHYRSKGTADCRRTAALYEKGPISRANEIGTM